MKIKQYIDKNSRIVEKFHIPALDNVIALQNKKFLLWETVSWIPVINSDKDNVKTYNYLRWKQLKNNPSIKNNEILKNIMLQNSKNQNYETKIHHNQNKG